MQCGAFLAPDLSMTALLLRMGLSHFPQKTVRWHVGETAWAGMTSGLLWNAGVLVPCHPLWA